MTLSLILDLVVTLLLGTTIFYAGILNRRLVALRSNKGELDALIHAFNDSCMRAEAGVKTLRSATEEAQRLQQYLQRSQTLRDDLSFLLERGTSLADRLEGNVRSVRSEVQARGGNVVDATAVLRRNGTNGFADPMRTNNGDASLDSHAASIAVAERVLERSQRPTREPGRDAGRDRSALRAEARAAATAHLGHAAPANGNGSGRISPDDITIEAKAPRSKAERDLLQALHARR